MDFKAVISNCGDEKLYKTLSSEIERRLPTSSVQWKRSYGRPSKQVVLQANFLKFDSAYLSKKVDSASSLGSKPLLHIFWTSCLDNDTYKSKVRNHILRWYKQLQESSTPDWIIVHVMYQEGLKTGKSKIQLPRTSVYDKIKTEFGHKLQDRCLQLWEPDKETLFTKSGESWQALLSQLRFLLLESFGQQLDGFEDRIRVLRERYASPDWPFLKYFIVHEELALIYQSITLKEDALVQYDEVDALLSQFIINSSARGLPNWLETFRTSPFKWDGVILRKNAIEHYRECIIKENISLLEFRNYLFARQCKLLIKNKRKWEIPSRLQEFLFTVVHELKILKVDASEAVISCWITLTCLHFFDVLESYESKDHLFNSTLAQICDYLRQKIKHIGEVTGLYYPREQTQDEIKLCQILSNGFGQLDSNISKMENTILLPSQRLRSVLESKIEFKQIYLDISCKCLNMLSDVKRTHFSIFVGIDLAKFYLSHGQYLDAEPLLEKAWSVYNEQKWQTLYTDVLIPLADCQLKHKLYDRYLNSVTLLSSSSCLSTSIREHYTKEFIGLAHNNALALATISADPVLKLEQLKINLVKNKGHIGDVVSVTLTIRNALTENVTLKNVSILCRHCDLNNPRSFSEDPISPRRSIFDQTDYGMDVSLISAEKTKDSNNAKEPLTPSSLLKRIKSHRRTWSKNRNTLEENKDEIEINSVEDISKQKNLSTSSQSVSSISNPKKTLFAADNSEESSVIINGDVLHEDVRHDVKRSKSEPVYLHEEAGSFDDQAYGLKRSSKVMKTCDLPIATSSLSGSPLKRTELRSLDSNDTRDSDSTPDESSLFVQPEIDEILDQLLVSESNVTLHPGANSVQLTTKIMHEGRYVLECIDCVISNLKLYKLFTLPQSSRSFFMVADPPKVAWTTDYVVDYLLTGSKQRLHITLLNGPGVILDGAILEISSTSGLNFYSLTSSSIQVFPLERAGKAREAAISIEVIENGSLAKLRLPYCRPYERINIYFDVVAPVHRKAGESSMCQHDISFICGWLRGVVDSSIRLDCIFYEPFQVKCETIYKSNRTFVKVSLCGVNPVPLMFSSPQLVSSNANYAFQMMSKCQELHLFGCEESSLLWELQLKGSTKLHVNILLERKFYKFLPSSQNCETEELNEINCSFTIDFTTNNSDEDDFGSFQQNVSIILRQHVYSVLINMVSEEVESSKPCRVSVAVSRNSSNHPSGCRLFLMLNPEHSGGWRYLGSQNYTEVVFTEGKDEIKLEILLLTESAGYIAMPSFKLLMSHQMEMMLDRDILELLTQLPSGEVMYSTLGSLLNVKTKSENVD